MNNKKIYQTNQKELVLEYIKNNSNYHIHASDVYHALKDKNIGLTTIYRHLDKLTSEGLLIKSIVDENSPACYEYTGHKNSENCYHLKCLKCGKLIHLHCMQIDELENHILADHGFKVDKNRTSFFGLCKECQE